MTRILDRIPLEPGEQCGICFRPVEGRMWASFVQNHWVHDHCLADVDWDI